MGVRNVLIVRQWQLLIALTTSRHGLTLAALSGRMGVCERTIRRDLAALAEVFPMKREPVAGAMRYRVLLDDVIHVLHGGVRAAALSSTEAGEGLAQEVRR